MLGESPSILNTKWPVYDPSKTVDEIVTIVFQVNGKVRAKVEMSKGINKDELIEKAMQNERIKEYTNGKKIIKKIAVPDKLVNIVIN